MNRTSLFASSATDTLRTVAVFHRVHFHLTSLCTFSTTNAFVHIHTITVNGHSIKYRIKCAKRTDISAKRSVYNNRKNDCYNQNRILPHIKPSDSSTHCLVQKHQRKSSLQCSCRTDQFTEIRGTLSHNICKKQREKNHKHQKNHIFHLSKKLVPFESTNFLWKRNLIQQILDQSKWAKKTTHQSSQDRAYENQKSDYIIGKFKVPASNHGL